MQHLNLKKVPFINPSEKIKSFSLRAAAIMPYGEFYLMVVNENDTKFKHPGGHLDINESLIEGLQREIKEEIGLEISVVDDSKVFCDHLLINGNIIITVYFQFLLDKHTLDKALSNSPLPTKLLRLSELNTENSWESEINAIKYFERKAVR